MRWDTAESIAARLITVTHCGMLWRGARSPSPHSWTPEPTPFCRNAV